MEQTFFESEAIILNYYKSERLVELLWKRTPTSDEFRDAYTLAAQYAQNHKVSCFLSDMRNEGIIDMSNIKWLESEIIPAAIKLGIKKIALVSEETFYSTLYAETLKKKLENSSMQVRILSDISEAKAWLIAN